MANLEHLKTLGMRAYELGRLRRASRIALLLVPLVVACLAEPRERQACASLGALLLGGCIWMRWRSRQGSDIASVGLLAGSIPLLLGVAQSALGVECDEGLPELSCLVLCALGGVAGGVLIARRAPAWRTGHDSSEAPRHPEQQSVLAAAQAGVVAALAAGLGCLRLGAAAVVAAAAGVIAGMVVAAAAWRPA